MVEQQIVVGTMNIMGTRNVEDAPAVHGVPAATRLNIGSGAFPLEGYCNIDGDPNNRRCNLIASVPPIPYPDSSMDEIYAGHFLEHLDRPVATLFVEECYRCLKPGGKLGIVVPDTREIMKRYVMDIPSRVEYPVGRWRDICDLDEMCDLFLYSTAQESHHVWSYDPSTLKRLLVAAGFTVVGDINRWMDPRITVGAWYQFGLDAIK